MNTLAMRWNRDWSFLFKALAVSLVLHLLVSLVISLAPSLPGELDAEWEGRMADLAGIGHGDEDFDDQEEVDFDEMAEFVATSTDDAEEEPEEEPEEVEEEESEEEEETEETEVEEEPEETEPDESDPEQEEEPEPGASEDPEPEPEPEPEPAPEPEPEVYAGELPAIDRSSPSNLPDMRNYGPGNARITALVRTDRIRGTALESPVSAVIRSIPDYRIALDGTGLDPVTDLDSFFMASSDPESLHQTFLAARHSYETDELRAVLDNRHGDAMPWETDGDRPIRRLVPESAAYNDPRRLMLAMDGLALIGQPSWFTGLMDPVDPDSDLGREIAESEDGPSAFALLDGLARIEEVADADDTLLLLSGYGFYIKDLPFVDPIPRFQSARLSITDAAAPKVTIDVRMRNRQGARELTRKCPRLRNQLGRMASLFGLRKALDPLQCRQEGEYVVIEGEYTQADLIELLELAPNLIGAIEPRSLRGLPTGVPADP